MTVAHRTRSAVVFEGVDGPVTLAIGGGLLRTLRALVVQRARGATFGGEPAPHLSAHLFTLRALGLVIDAIPEPRGGPFPGSHGRYVLRTVVAIGGVA